MSKAPIGRLSGIKPQPKSYGVSPTFRVGRPESFLELPCLNR